MVQIQNASGFALSVLTAGSPYTIQPQTATTIPTVGDGSQITITPQATSQNQTGTVTLVWLLEGQSSPIPDGYLTSQTAAQRNAGTYSLGASLSTGIPLLPTDEAIVLSIYPYPIGPGYNYNLTYKLQGNNSSITTSSTVVATGVGGALVLGPFPVYGSVDTSELLTITNNLGVTYLVQVTILSSGYTQGSVSITNTVPVAGGSKIGVGGYTYGGASRVGNPAISAASFVTMLSAPAAGFSYRLHSWTIFGFITTGANNYISLLDSSVTLATMTTVAEPGFQYLGGLIVTDAVRLYSTSAYGAGGIVLAYDLISTPTLT